MPRKKLDPVDLETRRTIGALLRDLRRAGGYRAVHDAAAVKECPAAQQTIYAYERGGLVPSLKQFMDLVEFYALNSEGATAETRYMAVAALVKVLSLPNYHVSEAFELIQRLQPSPYRQVEKDAANGDHHGFLDGQARETRGQTSETGCDRSVHQRASGSEFWAPSAPSAP